MDRPTYLLPNNSYARGHGTAMSIKTVAGIFLSLIGGCTLSHAQSSSPDDTYSYVANTRPPMPSFPSEAIRQHGTVQAF